MTDLSVRPIVLPDEADALARLCWNYRSFLVPRAAHVPDMVETYYAEDDYAALTGCANYLANRSLDGVINTHH